MFLVFFAVEQDHHFFAPSSMGLQSRVSFFCWLIESRSCLPVCRLSQTDITQIVAKLTQQKKFLSVRIFLLLMWENIFCGNTKHANSNSKHSQPQRIDATEACRTPSNFYSPCEEHYLFQIIN